MPTGVDTEVDLAFRHVQHVRPNRGPTKRGPKKDKNCFFFIFCNMSIMTTDYCACRPQQCQVKAVGGLRGIHILGAPTFFSEQWPRLK